MGGDWYFLFGYEFLDGFFDNFLIGVSYVYGVKSGVRKLLHCFLLVEVCAPNDYRAAFTTGCFDDEVIPVFEIYESSPFFFRKFEKVRSLIWQLALDG